MTHSTYLIWTHRSSNLTRLLDSPNSAHLKVELFGYVDQIDLRKTVLGYLNNFFV